MAKSKSPVTQRRNPPPVVAPETWRELLATADEFLALAPWGWMYDSQLVGLYHPQTGERLICSVLGRVYGHRAVNVYRNPAGHRWIINTVLEDADEAVDLDGYADQDCLKLDVLKKSEVSPDARALYAALKYKSRTDAGRTWPAFWSFRPGYFPWFLEQAEAETMGYALPRVAAYARLTQSQPQLSDGRVTGEVPFLPRDYTPDRPLGAADLDWHPMLAPPEPVPEVFTASEAAVARLRRLPLGSGFLCELDAFYGPHTVAGKKRPWVPRVGLLADAKSGHIFGYAMAQDPETEPVRLMGDVLLKGIREAKVRPGRVFVRRECDLRALTKVAGLLEIRLYQQASLPRIVEARESMRSYFAP